MFNFSYELCRPTKNTVCEPADRIRCKYEYKDYNKEVCKDVAKKVCEKVCQCEFHIRFSYLDPIFCLCPIFMSYAKTYYHFKFRSGRKTTVAGLTNTTMTMMTLTHVGIQLSPEQLVFWQSHREIVSFHHKELSHNYILHFC